jgi:hypothetical protein
MNETCSAHRELRFKGLALRVKFIRGTFDEEERKSANENGTTNDEQGSFGLGA